MCAAGEDDFALQFGGAAQFAEITLRHVPSHAVGHLIESVEEQNDLAQSNQMLEPREADIAEAALAEMADDDAFERDLLANVLERDEHGRGMPQRIVAEAARQIVSQEA